MKKTIVFWLTFGAAVLAAVYLIVRLSMSMTGTGAGPRIGTVSLDAGTGPLAARDISGAIGLAAGQPVHSADIDTIFSTISGHSAVRSASVRKIPSGRIAIMIRQREIIAIWTDGARYWPLAADGQRLENTIAAPPAGAVVFSGKLPDDIASVVRTMRGVPGLSNLVRRLEWIENRRWNLYTNSGIKVMLPEADLTDSLRKLVALHNQNRILDRGISVLDMRDSARTLVKIGR
jgi:cell division protein FtsQ